MFSHSLAFFTFPQRLEEASTHSFNLISRIDETITNILNLVRQITNFHEALKILIGDMKKSPLPLQNVHRSDKNVAGKESLVKLLRWHFGHADFRGKQLEAIQAVVSGNYIGTRSFLFTRWGKLE